MVDSQYFTPRQAAEVLTTDDEQVLAWIHSGELVAINIAKSANLQRPRWRISESDLAKFLMARRHPASMHQPAPKASKREEPKKYV